MSILGVPVEAIVVVLLATQAAASIFAYRRWVAAMGRALEPGCQTCDRVGPFLPMQQAGVDLHRAAHEAWRAAARSIEPALDRAACWMRDLRGGAV